MDSQTRQYYFLHHINGYGGGWGGREGETIEQAVCWFVCEIISVFVHKHDYDRRRRG